MARAAAVDTLDGGFGHGHTRSLAVVRVVAGEFGGRRLVAPGGVATRPTTDKVRQAVFNALDSMGVVEGALVVDLYAGSGAVGLEALSRGAAHCTFVERDRGALDALRMNIESLRVADRCTVIAADVLAWLPSAPSVDLVFVDPPYAAVDWPGLLGLLARAGLVIAESDREVAAPAGWESVRSRRYGRTWVTFLRP